MKPSPYRRRPRRCRWTLGFLKGSVFNESHTHVLRSGIAVKPAEFGLCRGLRQAEDLRRWPALVGLLVDFSA
jgi:hypothetical protein